MERPLEGFKIGFIGLGLMGEPMARHLLGAGAALTVHNRSRAAVDRLAALGAAPAASPAEVARATGAGIICLSLPETAAVAAVLTGENGILGAAGPGTLVIDTGTTAVAETRRHAELLRGRGIAQVDAPVSGGQVGAEAGDLTIFVGGGAEDVARSLPVLRAFGGRITHLGPPGCGQVGKYANQVIVALTVGAVAEALVLGRSAGVDPAVLRDALRGGFADSRVLDLHGGRMVAGDFEPGGRTINQLRDVENAVRLMEDCGLELPALRAARGLWEEFSGPGGGAQLDHCALVRHLDPEGAVWGGGETTPG